MTTPSSLMWGGRFSEATDAFVAEFTASVNFDKRLYKHDIQGSIAHATMLHKVGVLNTAEHTAIVDGLNAILAEIETGQFEWRVELEDVHMNIEARLTDRIGIAGKKLHTGRSRNDQVATDIRLYLRDEIIICWLGLKCWCVMMSVWPIAANGLIVCLWVRRHWLAQLTPLTALTLPNY